MAKYGLVYAGAQKNLGPAGVTVVVVRRDLLDRVPTGLPALLDYRLLDENKSLYNTPPCFAIYVVGLVLKWLRDQGGLAGMETVVISKADRIYRAIDGSGAFYRGHAQKEARSRMNVTFRLPSEDLEKAFVKQATADGPGRAQGPPLGRRPAGFALQRVACGIGGCPRGFHAGVPAPERLRSGRRRSRASGVLAVLNP